MNRKIIYLTIIGLSILGAITFIEYNKEPTPEELFKKSPMEYIEKYIVVKPPLPSPEYSQCFYYSENYSKKKGHTISSENYWVCNNYEASKLYLDKDLLELLKQNFCSFGIAHTTGNYVFIYLVECDQNIGREGVKTQYMVYIPQTNEMKDLNHAAIILNGDMSFFGVTKYEVLWMR